MKNTPVQLRLIGSAAGLCLVLLLGSCAGSEETPLAGNPIGPASEDSAASQQLSPEMWDMLTKELERVLAEEGRDRSTSAVSTGKGSAVGNLDLYAKEGVGASLGWNYRNQGDYDLNGVVTIADLTPIGLHFGKSFADSDWQQAQMADGDRNGEVNIGDVTPIGQNFGGQVDGFELQSRNELIFPPDESFGTVERFPFVAGDPSSGEYPFYEYEMGLIIAGPQFRVVPYVEDGMNYTYGPPSNLVGTLGGADHWPTRGGNTDRNGRSRSKGPLTSNIEWVFEAEGTSFIYGTPVADDNGNVYFGTAESFGEVDSQGWIHAIGPDGSQNWRFTTGGVLMTPAIGPKGNVIFADTKGLVYSMTPDGVQEWRSEVVGIPALTSITFDNDQGISLQTIDIGGMSSTSVAYRFLPDGTLDWNRTFDRRLELPFLIDPDGRLVLGDEDGVFHFYLTDGTFDTSMNTMLDVPFLSNAMTVGTNLVVPDDSVDQILVQPYSGLLGILVPLPAEISAGPSSNSDGHIVVGVTDGAVGISNLLIIDQAGVTIDVLPVPGRLLGSIAIDVDDRMYFWRIVDTDPENPLYFVRCIEKDGTLRWEEPMERIGFTPIIAGDGRLALLTFSETMGSASGTRLVMLSE